MNEKAIEEARARGEEIMRLAKSTKEAERIHRKANGLAETKDDKLASVANAVRNHIRFPTEEEAPAPPAGLVGEIEATRARGQAVIDSAKRGLKTFPPAKQVLKK